MSAQNAQSVCACCSCWMDAPGVCGACWTHRRDGLPCDQSGHDECPDICARQAATQLLGPLRPNACICAHGVRRTLGDVFPPAQIDGPGEPS